MGDASFPAEEGDGVVATRPCLGAELALSVATGVDESRVHGPEITGTDAQLLARVG